VVLVEVSVDIPVLVEEIVVDSGWFWDVLRLVSVLFELPKVDEAVVEVNIVSTRVVIEDMNELDVFGTLVEWKADATEVIVVSSIVDILFVCSRDEVVCWLVTLEVSVKVINIVWLFSVVTSCDGNDSEKLDVVPTTLYGPVDWAWLLDVLSVE
jgi:hypothetical protein